MLLISMLTLFLDSVTLLGAWGFGYFGSKNRTISKYTSVVCKYLVTVKCVFSIGYFSQVLLHVLKNDTFMLE